MIRKFYPTQEGFGGIASFTNQRKSEWVALNKMWKKAKENKDRPDKNYSHDINFPQILKIFYKKGLMEVIIVRVEAPNFLLFIHSFIQDD